VKGECFAQTGAARGSLGNDRAVGAARRQRTASCPQHAVLSAGVGQRGEPDAPARRHCEVRISVQSDERDHVHGNHHPTAVHEAVDRWVSPRHACQGRAVSDAAQCQQTIHRSLQYEGEQVRAARQKDVDEVHNLRPGASRMYGNGQVGSATTRGEALEISRGCSTGYPWSTPKTQPPPQAVLNR
jgi:hypothetical protein